MHLTGHSGCKILMRVPQLLSACRSLSPKAQLLSVSLNSQTHLTQISSFHLSSVMPIKVGDSIPSAELYENTPNDKINIADFAKGKKIVLFAVPGAFTPGCSKTHLPGFVHDSAEIKAKGVDEIFCVSVNDPFVMAAWAKDQKTEGKVRLLADPAATFTKLLELDVNLPPLGGTRSKRYSMVIEDGVVTKLNVEPDGTGLACSLSKNLHV